MLKKISSFFTSKYILILVVLLCSALIVASFFTDKLVAPVRNVVSTLVMPIQDGMNYIGLWVSDGYEKIQEATKLLEENQSLKSKVDELTEENNKLKQDTYELKRLRDLYKLDESYANYAKVGARIIGTSSDNWYSCLLYTSEAAED